MMTKMSHKLEDTEYTIPHENFVLGQPCDYHF